MAELVRLEQSGTVRLLDSSRKGGSELGLGEGGGRGLIAARAGMRSRQQYRTMARMQRRRSYMADKMGVREDFTRNDQQAAEPAPASAPAPQQDYTEELEKLAKLRDEGVVSDEEFGRRRSSSWGSDRRR